jgi:hypothetical protein
VAGWRVVSSVVVVVVEVVGGRSEAQPERAPRSEERMREWRIFFIGVEGIGREMRLPEADAPIRGG